MARPLQSSAVLFRPERFLEKVQRRTGAAGLLPTSVTDALEVLCRSLVEDANLSFFGQRNLEDLILTGLDTRARMEQAFAAEPQLEQLPLRPPLIVCGLPRSGTTFLHRLLGAAGDARALPMWETIFPLAPEGLDTRRIEVGLKARIFKWANASKMDPVRLIRSELPDECIYLMRMDLRTSLFWVGCPSFSYLDWMLEQDFVGTYRVYRRLLGLLQRAAPRSNQRLTLKNPGHTLCLPALLEAIPSAMVVRTHRDPLQTVPSYHKLVAVSQASTTHGVDLDEVVASNTKYLLAMAQRSVELDRERTRDRVFDVDYRDLVADPVGTVNAIYTHFGLPFGPGLRSRLHAFVAQNRQHGSGSNPYSIEQFGQTREELSESFAAYRQKFIMR